MVSLLDAILSTRRTPHFRSILRKPASFRSIQSVVSFVRLVEELGLGVDNTLLRTILKKQGLNQTTYRWEVFSSILCIALRLDTGRESLQPYTLSEISGTIAYILESLHLLSQF